MIINKSCAFQLPQCRTNAKKIFLVFKKISKSPEEFCDFFRLAAGDHESIAPTESRSEKMAPRSNRGAVWIHDDILFRECCFSYGTIFLMENPARPAWPPAAVRLSCAST